MDSFLKHHFWIITLAVLAVIAWLSARVVNQLLACEIASWSTTPTPNGGDQNKKAKDRIAGEEDPTYKAITDRNLFNSNPPPEEDDQPKPSDDSGENAVGGLPGPHDECKKSDIKAEVLMTFVAEPSSGSRAVIENKAENKSRLMVEGQKLDDYTIVSIQRARVVFKHGSGYECIWMDPLKGITIAKPKGSKGGSASKAAPSSSSADDEPPPLEMVDISSNVRKTGQDSYEIDRSGLDNALNNSGDLSRQARVIPHYRDGKQQGFKIVGIRPGSIYSNLGVNSGDILTSLNQDALNTPDQSLALFEYLKNNDNVALDIERRGRKVTLEYSIK